MFVNNCSEEQEKSITSYVTEFTQKFKSIEKIDKSGLRINSIKKNVGLTLIIWLAGTTIIGMPVVLAIILFRGFCMGYTISAITYTIGTGKSFLFCFFGLTLQNVLFIPALLTMGVSSIKLYKAIVNDRRKENIKIEVIRHLVISCLMLIVLGISSILECEVSVGLLRLVVNYI